MTGNGSNNNNGTKGIDARNLTLPIITIVSILGFVMWVTYIFSTEIAAGRARLASIESTLIELKAQIGHLQTIKAPRGTLTSTDMAIFCLRAQILNKDWRCPSVNHTYDSMNSLNDADVLQEIQRLNRREGSISPLDKDKSPKPVQ